MTRYLIQFIFFLVITHSLPSLGNASVHWEKIGDEAGVVVYKREVPGSPVLAFKGSGIVNAPIEKVASVIFDTSRAPEWMVDLEESKILEWRSPTEFVEYDHIKTPPIIMKDRDFVSLVKMEVDSEGKTMKFLYQSIQDKFEENTKYIRGDLMSTTFELKALDNNTRTYITGEIHCDPKGAVPKWIVNWFQKDWPIDTLKNLRKQLEKPDVKANPRFLALFNILPKAALKELAPVK